MSGTYAVSTDNKLGAYMCTLFMEHVHGKLKQLCQPGSYSAQIGFQIAQQCNIGI